MTHKFSNLEIEIAAEIASGKYTEKQAQELLEEFNKSAEVKQAKESKVVYVDKQADSEIYEKRASLMRGSVLGTTPLQIKYSNWIDKSKIKNRKKIWTHKEHPYFYIWMPMTNDAASQSYRESLLARGYRPLDIRTVESQYVFGEEAIMLELPTDPTLLALLANRKIPAPPKTPDYLAGKWGTLTPLVARSSDGAVFGDGSKQLWYVEKEIRNHFTGEYKVRTAEQDPLAGEKPGLINESKRGQAFELDLNKQSDIMNMIMANSQVNRD